MKAIPYLFSKETTLSMEKQRYNVLLDLNGTLIYRTTKPVLDLPFGHHIKGKWYYRRLSSTPLLKELSKLANVYIYTSMIEHNVVSCLHSLYPDYKNFITGILDRRYNKPDPNGTESYDTVRDLDKIWNDQVLSKDIRPENTILVDNEARKVAEYSKNALIIPELGIEELKEGNTSVLDTLIVYLIKLVAKNPIDVREYLPLYPFPNSIGVTVSTPIEAAFDKLAISIDTSKLGTLHRCIEKYSCCTLSHCTVSIDYVDDKGVYLSELSKSLSVHVHFPLPTSMRIDKKIALSRLVDMNITTTYTFSTKEGNISITI